MGFLKGIFGIKELTCPRCLSVVDVREDSGVCPRCDFVLPIRYIKNYEYAKPLFVQVFGWTAHGKTVFLESLRLMLLDMGKLWPGYTHQPITQLDMDHDRTLRASLQKGKMPPATAVRDRRPDEVYMMLLDQMPRWQSRWLIIMDHAGELFSKMDVNVTTMPFLLKSPTTFMLMSIPRMRSDGHGESMDQLLSIYIETMLRSKVNFRKERRELVIVLTMADKIVGLPPPVRKYLMSDDSWSRLRGNNNAGYLTDAEMQAYLAGMTQADRDIRDWLRADAENAPGGANLVGLIEREGLNARFSAISATGYDIEPNAKEDIPISPHRVLDPFFWALEFQSR